MEFVAAAAAVLMIFNWFLSERDACNSTKSRHEVRVPVSIELHISRVVSLKMFEAIFSAEHMIVSIRIKFNLVKENVH